MLFSSDRIVKRIFALSLFAFLHVGWGHEVNVIESPAQGSVALASAILNKHPYLLNPEQRERLKQQVGEAEEVLATDLPDGAFEEMLESVDSKLVIDLEENPDWNDASNAFIEDVKLDSPGRTQSVTARRLSPIDNSDSYFLRIRSIKAQ